jgi:REP element-mobilizing transposase RayT
MPFGDAPLYFITFNTHQRQAFLADGRIHESFKAFAAKALSSGAAIGRYVLMPDHVHVFIRCAPALKMGQTVRLLKRSLSSSIQDAGPHWQPGFFDHILRQNESYAEKWEYVRLNPVRAGLVEDPDDWPFQGEVCELMM